MASGRGNKMWSEALPINGESLLLTLERGTQEATQGCREYNGKFIKGI
jgi:hypothetical protein